MADESQGKETDNRPTDLEPTLSLIARAQRGDEAAQNDLVRRYTAILNKWAHGRLPPAARDRADTDDLVQMTLFRTLERLSSFDVRGEGAFTAYLHKVLMNQIRDEIRRAFRRPRHQELGAEVPGAEPSPLDRALSGEFLDRYEAALSRLSRDQQRAVVMRIELGHTYSEIAGELGSPSANAARMVASRGLARLASLIDEREGG